ncbi:MAG: pyridoxamine 5'-phosphate oxidase [Xanthomonadaceae bacterium]|jgi:pyridoxamine 5'-phosphate oxidase|nr:pyridoxamine 5'-phosphate oxidase [Xanthomonadaceae bacterium]
MNDLYAEAMATFATLFDEAKASGQVEPETMIVATASLDAVPSSRAVLLKAYDARGFVFYTHMNSRKGHELQENPHAALLFLWRNLREAGVQVRIEGRAEQVSDEEADAYFATRPRTSQLGAWVSRQSEPLAAREDFEVNLEQVNTKFGGCEIPRPPAWHGVRIVPLAIEFWYGAEFRLHERWRYALESDGRWHKQMLYP